MTVRSFDGHGGECLRTGFVHVTNLLHRYLRFRRITLGSTLMPGIGGSELIHRELRAGDARRSRHATVIARPIRKHADLHDLIGLGADMAQRDCGCCDRSGQDAAACGHCCFPTGALPLFVALYVPKYQRCDLWVAWLGRVLKPPESGPRRNWRVPLPVRSSRTGTMFDAELLQLGLMPFQPGDSFVTIHAWLFSRIWKAAQRGCWPTNREPRSLLRGGRRPRTR
jgi:hypothetical protein